MSRLWIRRPAAVLAARDAGGGVVVAEGLIDELVPSGGAPTEWGRPGDSSVDASGDVILPGLINTHHHFFQTLTRAWRPVASAELFDWLTGLYDVWARLTPDTLASAVEVALVELLLSGCTTAADHHYLYPVGLEEAVDIEVAVARRLGVRAVLTRGSMTLGRDSGGLPPQSTVQAAEATLEDSRRVVEAYHERGPGAMVQVALAPCSPFSVTPEHMRLTAELATDLDVRLHTHLAETRDEEEFLRQSFGMRTVDYLESVGWLGPRTWVAHGVHFDDTEIARLGAAGVGVAHCPTSNMRLASGICRAVELEDAGAPVGLGVDGSASNDGSSLAAEIRSALYLQRLRYGASAITPERAYGWATRGSARCLGRDDIGVIDVGKQADLALFSLDDIRYAGAQDPLEALVLCGLERAHQVMVAGRWRVRDGQVIGVDLPALIARQREAAAKLIGR